MKTPAPVSLQRLGWTAGCFALATLANLEILPAWAIVTAFTCGAARLGLALRGMGLPGRGWRLLAAALLIGALLVQFHTFNGITAGTALLCLMGGLKLLETRSHRDAHIVLMIVYFLCLAALLRSTSFWLLAYLIGVCWLTTGALLQMTVVEPGPSWRAGLRHSGRILLQALPLALSLWLLFPRLTEPLWGISDDSAEASTGLSDTMNPGDISELVQSEEVAFRVRFAGTPPPPAMLYWRGPVLNDFDGSQWRRGEVGPLHQVPRSTTEYGFRYTISLEPYRQKWIYLLDRPVLWDLPRATLMADYVLVQPEVVSRPLDVVATSATSATIPLALNEWLRRIDLRLPPGRNPRTLELARQLRAAHPDNHDYLRSVLGMLHDDAFYYTLTPPRLGADPVDAFLFESKRGFCGHYASAFTVLMRAAGIPARIVTGYAGGKPNPYGDYWIVRQSDAHAWVEVWLDEAGWQRVDPTAAVARERVIKREPQPRAVNERLILQLSGKLPWFTDLRLRFDALRQVWRERILQFDQNAQQALLERLMIPEPSVTKLVVALGAALSLAFLWLTWQVRNDLTPRPRDPVARAFRQLCQRLARCGFSRLPFEGAQDFGLRVARARPDLAGPVLDLVRQYHELRYGATASADSIAGFQAAVRGFRPQRHQKTA